MENWENKMIGEKLNSLVDLPEGYNPDLLSKWEIIEAGFPKQKRKMTPLLKWAVAAAIIGVVFYSASIFFSTNKKQFVLHLSAHKISSVTSGTAVNTQANKAIKLAKQVDLTSKKVIPIDNSQPLFLAKKENKKALIETSMPALNDTSIHTIMHIQPIEETPLIAAAKVQKIKPAKAKIFQKDFVDEVLTMDKPSKNAGEHPSLKLQFNKNNVEESGQSSPALQWKKSF